MFEKKIITQSSLNFNDHRTKRFFCTKTESVRPFHDYLENELTDLNDIFLKVGNSKSVEKKGKAMGKKC